MKGRLLAAVQAVLLALVILAGAIALPIVCRPFYDLHIEPMGLTERTGLTVGQIKQVYREMMDYCIGWKDTFSVGILPFSESGASHFADVRKLFVLDLRVLVLSALLLIPVMLCRRKHRAELLRHTPGFWSAVGLGVTFLTVGTLAALDFNRAFTLFHKRFFSGKENWIFDGRTDPVIKLLPEAFFRNCAVLILAAILISCTLLWLHDAGMRHKKSRLQ